MTKVQWILFVASPFLALSAEAQTMYRCGNTFSQTPCGSDAQKVPVPLPGNCNDMQFRDSPSCVEKERVQRQERMKILREQAEQDLARDRAAAEKRKLERDELIQRATAPYKEAGKLLEENKDRPPPSPAVVRQNIQACTQAVRSTLKDPESARIGDAKRDRRTYDDTRGTVVVGVSYLVEVNAKNSFGAYTGMKTHTCFFDMNESKLLFVNAPRD